MYKLLRPLLRHLVPPNNEALINYANCWEDPQVVIESLEAGQTSSLLCVGSGGDNCLSLLSTGAAVLAVDANLSQLACLELKCAAFSLFDYRDLLGFLGVHPSANRAKMFESLAPMLRKTTLDYWLCHKDTIETGLIHSGRCERRLQFFSDNIVGRLHDQATIRKFFEPMDSAQRRRFYDRVWNTVSWRCIVRAYTSYLFQSLVRPQSGNAGHIREGALKELRSRIHEEFSREGIERNPFISYILTGNFLYALPYYLREEAFEPIRRNLSRLTVWQGWLHDLERADLEHSLDGANLSDVFEYMPPQHVRSTYEAVVALMKPNARMVHWGMLTRHRASMCGVNLVYDLESASAKAIREDTSIFYTDLVVEGIMAGREN